jgi:hypothetical protein
MVEPHTCLYDAPYEVGPAIDECIERNDGTLWVGNPEFSSRVNFCPFCGYAAKVKLEIKNG